jgi:hypothetical protein
MEMLHRGNYGMVIHCTCYRYYLIAQLGKVMGFSTWLCCNLIDLCYEIMHVVATLLYWINIPTLWIFRFRVIKPVKSWIYSCVLSDVCVFQNIVCVEW